MRWTEEACGTSKSTLFATMEEEVREHFRFSALVWCMLTAEIEEIHAQTVLDILVSLWVTICGFSFARQCVY